MTFISFSCCITLAKISAVMLNREETRFGEYDHGVSFWLKELFIYKLILGLFFLLNYKTYLS